MNAREPDGRRRARSCASPRSTACIVALACHINPDGDALGSMLGLLHVLRADGRDVVASFSSPFDVAPHYRELPGLDLLTKPGDFPAEPEVMVTFDCGSLGRLGELEPGEKAARELIVLDHHVSNTRYGTINVIDPDAAASGVVVRRLVHELGLPLNDDAAVALYAALVCDTGRFQYDTTTPAVFELARELVEYDVPVSRLSPPAVRGAPLRVPQAARRGARQRRARRRATLRVDRGHPGHARASRRDDRRGRRPDRHPASHHRGRGHVRAQGRVDGSVRVSLRSLGDVDVQRDRGRARRWRPSVRGGLRVDARHPERRRAHPRAL